MTENTHIRFAPSQKEGMASPKTATTITTRSIQVLAFHAARMPRGMAIIIATSCENSAMKSVGSRRWAISVVTLNLLKMDSPKSPRRMSLKYMSSLLCKGPVQPHVGAYGGNLLGGSLIACHQAGGVARRDMYERKGNKRDHQQNGNHCEKPLDCITRHSVTSIGCLKRERRKFLPHSRCF